MLFTLPNGPTTINSRIVQSSPPLDYYLVIFHLHVCVGVTHSLTTSTWAMSMAL